MLIAKKTEGGRVMGNIITECGMIFKVLEEKVCVMEINL